MKTIKKISVLIMAVVILAVFAHPIEAHAKYYAEKYVANYNTTVVTWPSSGNYRITTSMGSAVVSMYSDANGYNCLWSSDWSNENTNTGGRTYWVGSDVRCIKVRAVGNDWDIVSIEQL